MTDRRINGQPAVYCGPEPVFNYPDLGTELRTRVPESGATVDTDPRICETCGQVRALMCKPEDFLDKYFLKGQTGPFLRQCRACLEPKRPAVETKKAKTRAKKATEPEDGVPF